MCASLSARVGVYGVGAGRTGRASSAPSSSSARSAGGTTSSPTPAAGAAADSTGNKPASGHKLIEVAETNIPSSLPISPTLPPSLPIAPVASLRSKPLHSSLQSSLSTSLTTSSSWTTPLTSPKLASEELVAGVEVSGLTGPVSPPGRTSGTGEVTEQPPGGGEASSLTARAR